MPPANANENYCTFTLAGDVTAGGLPSEDDIAKVRRRVFWMKQLCWCFVSSIRQTRIYIYAVFYGKRVLGYILKIYMLCYVVGGGWMCLSAEADSLDANERDNFRHFPITSLTSLPLLIITFSPRTRLFITRIGSRKQ